MFQKATREKLRLRMGLAGPAGSGKSYTALRTAMLLAREYNTRVACIEAGENGGLTSYLGESPDGTPFEFDLLKLDNFSPEMYTRAIKEAGNAGYGVIVVDSLSHAWAGTGGALDIKSMKSSGKGENDFTAWRHVTPLHNSMIDAILNTPSHIICTIRSKMSYEMVKDPITGKVSPQKVGTEPIQRAGMEYEFGVFADITTEHVLTVTKTRCSLITDLTVRSPGPELVNPLVRWMKQGIDTPKPVQPQPEPQPAFIPAAKTEPSEPLTIRQQLNHEIERLELPQDKLAKRLQEKYGRANINEMSDEECQDLLGVLRAVKQK